MPIYEFDCRDCGQPFEELVLSSNAVKDVACPNCGSQQIRKKLSTFASKIAGGGASYSASAPSCAPGGT